MKGHEIWVVIFVHQAHKVHLLHVKKDFTNLPTDRWLLL
jgi:hypothetical protein